MHRDGKLSPEAVDAALVSNTGREQAQNDHKATVDHILIKLICSQKVENS